MRKGGERKSGERKEGGGEEEEEEQVKRWRERKRTERKRREMTGRLQCGLHRLRSDLGRILLSSPPQKRKEERRRREEPSGHPLFRGEEKRRVTKSCSVPVQGRRRVGEEEEKRGESEDRRGRGRHAPVVESRSLPQLPPTKEKLHRAPGLGGWAGARWGVR